MWVLKTSIISFLKGARKNSPLFYPKIRKIFAGFLLKNWFMTPTWPPSVFGFLTPSLPMKVYDPRLEFGSMLIYDQDYLHRWAGGGPGWSRPPWKENGDPVPWNCLINPSRLNQKGDPVAKFLILGWRRWVFDSGLLKQSTFIQKFHLLSNCLSRTSNSQEYRCDCYFDMADFAWNPF